MTEHTGAIHKSRSMTYRSNITSHCCHLHLNKYDPSPHMLITPSSSQSHGLNVIMYLYLSHLYHSHTEATSVPPPSTVTTSCETRHNDNNTASSAGHLPLFCCEPAYFWWCLAAFSWRFSRVPSSV